jgi:ribosomal protein L34
MMVLTNAANSAATITNTLSSILSIVRKKRKMGYLVRQRTVGGRRTLNPRRAKGRAQLRGGIKHVQMRT